METSIVIVGAGQAGGWAARTLRGEGFKGEVVLIGEEPHPPYERPPLSKAVLAGTASPHSAYLHTAEALERLEVDWRRRARVERIERANREVILDSGASVAYDTLILCTGGHARLPIVPGTDLPGVFTLRTIEDSVAIAQKLDSAKRLLVVGGGWIGLEVASTARTKGVQVTLIEATATLCGRSLPSALSTYLQALHHKNEVKLVLESGLVGIERDSRGSLCIGTTDGREFCADIVVIGIGLVANDRIAEEAGLECRSGVLVDKNCRTTDAAIFAAGDVAVLPTRWSNHPLRLESWQNAQDQGIAAAKSALGQPISYDPLPWFWSDQYNVNMQIFGLPDVSHRIVMRGSAESGQFLAFCMKEDRVKAAVGVNSARDLRFARRLIEQCRTVSDADLSNPAIALGKL